MKPTTKYWILAKKLRFIRDFGLDEKREDKILDEMDKVWWDISSGERAMLDRMMRKEGRGWEPIWGNWVIMGSLIFSSLVFIGFFAWI